MTYLKMLIEIKSFNPKYCTARLSPSPVKLRRFIGGKFPPPHPPKKERVMIAVKFMIAAYLCACKFKELYDLRYKN